MRILITGGAGYIGSHASKRLLDLGHQVTVIDDLQHGHREAIDRRAHFLHVNLTEQEVLRQILVQDRIEAVLHFAGSIEVGESVVNPSLYYHNNFANGLVLLNVLRDLRIERFVFSSTAAVYGNPKFTPITEDHGEHPVNPYGRTKYFFEQALSDFHDAYGLGYVSLRYFNVAGASSDLKLGEAHEPETHLIPRILEVANGKKEFISIFGSDYPTPDGTCVRDFIHVEDLVEAHVLSLERLEPRTKKIYNLGSAQGFSVRQVIEVCRDVTKRPIAVKEEARRPGDPAILVASSALARKELGWTPRYPELKTMVQTAWDWHRTHPNGYKT